MAIYLGITVAISLLAIFCASRMKSALSTAPSGRKAPDRRPPGLHYGADYPARRRHLRGPGKSRRGGYRLSQVRKHVGLVRRQPPPGRNRRQVFPLLSRPPGPAVCQALWLSS
ncbi:hypothetical protein LNP74_21755 [Klebsiella pneumoniae subsp. pneumoniae]|nr:hypothetical protein [Klebsiella pneumoniae subsp. pneumoniae]